MKKRADCGVSCVCEAPLGFCFENEARVEKGVVYDSEGCASIVQVELVRGLSEGMHATSFFFGDGPPRGA